MNSQPAQKMEAFKPSVFNDVKQAVQSAQNRFPGGVIDLSLGSPDLPPHKDVMRALAEASLNPASYGYTLSGTADFHRAVADYYKKRSGVTLHPETEIVQTMGSQEGLVHLPLAFCDPGDIVLITNPAYVAYETGIRLAGAVSYDMPLLEDNGFLPDIDAIPPDIAQKAKLMILNMPGNPISVMPDKAFMERVVSFAKQHAIIVLHDAAYAEFYFTGDRPFSFLAVEGAKDIGLETNSLSKSFSLAGARIAYIAGNAELIQTIKQLKSNLDYGVFAPVQQAAVQALELAEPITDALRAEFSARAEAMSRALQSIGWPVSCPRGGMFIWARIPSGTDDRAFVFDAIQTSGVAMIPGSAFGSHGAGYVRIALVQPVSVLKEAAARLQSIV